MKTFLITSVLFVSGIWVIVAIHNDELQDYQFDSAKWANQHIVDSLKREIRFGPRPYCLLHPIFPRTAKQQDSLMQYFSHLTFGELKEIKDGATEPNVRASVNALIAYKDSIYFLKNGHYGASYDD